LVFLPISKEHLFYSVLTFSSRTIENGCDGASDKLKMLTSNKFSVAIWCLLAATQMYGQKLPLIEVKASSVPRYEVPVYVKLDKPLDNSHTYTLKNVKTGQTAPVQLLSTGQLVFILPDSLPPNTSATYRFVKSTSNPKPSVQIEKTNTGLQVRVNQKPVFLYNTATAQPASGNPAYYARSGFIHPLQSPKGKIVTDDFPIGHVHQHGIMMAWVNTVFRKKSVDFWNQHLQTGDVMHEEVISSENGAVSGVMKVKLTHLSKEFGKVLEDMWTITVYSINDYFLFDLQSTQTNTSADTLYLNKYHYGGFAFRGAKQWNADDSINFQNKWNVETDEKYTLADANGKHAAFVNISGKIDNEMVGVTIFGFPENIRYPQAIRVHPVMPYWAYTPVVDGSFAIPPGESLASRFRIYVYDGAGGQTRNRDLLNDLQNPVQVGLK